MINLVNSKKCLFSLSCCTLAFLLLQAGLWAQSAAAVVGSLKTAQGSAVVRRGTETIPAREGMHLLEHDILETFTDGRLGLILQDGTRISLGSGTHIMIDSFIYEPSQARFGLLLRMVRGIMAYISGKIAQFSPESVRVETPVGIVGVRGTHFAVTLEGPQE